MLANQAHLDPRVRFVPGTPVEPEALIAVPLIARGSLKGTLNIYRVGEDAKFTEEEFLLATRFGDAAALALDNAHIRATLEHQASTDALTGLYNHRTFHDRVREELMRASAEHDTVGLVMLDLDDFKKVNDVYGHGGRRPAPAPGGGRASRLRADDRRRLPCRRRGVRDHPPVGGPRARARAGASESARSSASSRPRPSDG